MLDMLFGEGQYGLRFLLAFIVVLGLIGLTIWLVRKFGAERLGAGNVRGRQPRLAVIDAAAVDGRRRLILIRRDNVEHLLMIGGPSDIVVEPNIVRGAAAQPARPAPVPEPAAREPIAAREPVPSREPIHEPIPMREPAAMRDVMPGGIPMREPAPMPDPFPTRAPLAEAPAARGPAFNGALNGGLHNGSLNGGAHGGALNGGGLNSGAMWPADSDLIPTAPAPREPMSRETMSREPMQRELMPREPIAPAREMREPMQRDPMSRDPMSRDPLPRDPMSRDLMGRDPMAARDPIPSAPIAPAPMAAPRGRALADEAPTWPGEAEPGIPPRRAPADPLAGLAAELSRGPAQSNGAAAARPARERQQPLRERPSTTERGAMRPPTRSPSRAPGAEPKANGAEHGQSDIAQRFEAALRRPTKPEQEAETGIPAFGLDLDPAPSLAGPRSDTRLEPEFAMAGSEAKPAANEAKPMRDANTLPKPPREAKPAQPARSSLYDSLEQEMASLIGRPD